MIDYKAETISMMSNWWQSHLGQYVLEQEQVRLKSLNRHFYGYFQLQIGGDRNMLPSVARPNCQARMAEHADIEGKAEALPFKCHSIDNLLLAHVLEFSADPHQVLREAERVLVSDGVVVISCFNPISLWGLRRLFSRRNKAPWHGHFFARSRIKDWLALLNFEVIATEKLLFSPPVRSSKWLERLVIMENGGNRFWPFLAGCTIYVAKKRTIPLTPIGMRWQTKNLFPAGRLVNNPISREKING